MKFNIFVEADRLISIWHNIFLADGGKWPEDYCRQLGQFTVATTSKILTFRMVCSRTSDFDLVVRQVSKSAGYRQVLIVADLSIQDGQAGIHRIHSMVGVHWNQDDTIACLNSWGVDSKPIIAINKNALKHGYFVDAVIDKIREASSKGDAVNAAIPSPSGEWRAIFPWTWKKLD